MYEQGMSLGQSLIYIVGGLLLLVCGLITSVKIAGIASKDRTFMASKSAVGSQAVVFNLILYLVGIALLLKGSGIDA